MINIDSVYQTVARLLRKNQQGKITPSEFNKYAQMANNSRFNALYGRPEDYKPGRAQATMAYPETREIDEKLSVFISVDSLSVSAGQAIKPAGLLRVDAITTVVDNEISPVKWVSKNSLAKRTRSKIMPPDTLHPIYSDYGPLGFTVYPLTINSIQVTYLKKPPVVKWAYTVDVNNRPIYNSAASVHFLWEDSEEGNIVALILQYASVSVQDQTGLSFGIQKEVKGQ